MIGLCTKRDLRDVMSRIRRIRDSIDGTLSTMCAIDRYVGRLDLKYSATFKEMESRLKEMESRLKALEKPGLDTGFFCMACDKKYAPGESCLHYRAANLLAEYVMVTKEEYEYLQWAKTACAECRKKKGG